MVNQLSIFDEVDPDKAAIECLLEMDIEAYKIQKDYGTHFIAYALTEENVYDVIVNKMIGLESAIVYKYCSHKVRKVIPKIFGLR